jgi:type I site-specific restriction-modification system R (restriction) subunit
MSYIHDQQPESLNDLFGEVIDSYTDAQALEDGVLVELYMPARFQEFPINRMTRHLFEDLRPLLRRRRPSSRETLAEHSPRF